MIFVTLGSAEKCGYCRRKLSADYRHAVAVDLVVLLNGEADLVPNPEMETGRLYAKGNHMVCIEANANRLADGMVVVAGYQ